MATRPACTALDALDDGRWSHTERGYVYELLGCQLVRPTAAAARRCLADRHLLFFGDSLVTGSGGSPLFFSRRGLKGIRFPLYELQRLEISDFC